MGNKTTGNEWPLSKFNFIVIIDGKECFFREVSGLDTETAPIEYRHGDSKQFSKIKMPGMQKLGNITLKRGLFKSDNHLWDWFSQIKTNTVKRSDIVIQLLDESQKPVMTWHLKNAWPVKVTSADLNAGGNEVAVETLELAHEGLTISNS